jgi:hypothetical protein
MLSLTFGRAKTQETINSPNGMEYAKEETIGAVPNGIKFKIVKIYSLIGIDDVFEIYQYRYEYEYNYKPWNGTKPKYCAIGILILSRGFSGKSTSSP